MSTKAVLFDIGGVVITCDLERYVPIACKLFRTNETSLRREVDLHVRDLERGIITSLEFWRLVEGSLYVKGEGTPAKDTMQYATLWRDLLVETLEINMPLLRLCQILARRGIIIGALSNTIEEHVPIFEERGVYIPFNPLLLSCRLGMRKPDDEIFKLAYRMAGVYPQECLFIDDVADNLPSARVQGMRTHLYKDMVTLLKYLKKLGLIKDTKWYSPPTHPVAAPAKATEAGELSHATAAAEPH